MDKKLKTTIDSYDNTVTEYIKNTDKLFPRAEAKKFLSLIPKSSKILDIGCGPGRDAKYFTAAKYEVVGVDLSGSMIKAAKIRVPKATFRKMNIENLRFKKEEFKGIWAHASLIHIPKNRIEKVLKDCHRILTKQGVLYISIKKGKGERFETDKRYSGTMKAWTYFSKKEILQLIKKAGFSPISCYVLKKNTKYQSHTWIIAFCQKKSLSLTNQFIIRHVPLF